MGHAEVHKKILSANDTQAAVLRQQFDSDRTLVVDLVSSPGSGKTSLLEATARRMAAGSKMAAVVGDIATELDAERLRAAGLPAHQIVTGGACHLDARLVTDGLEIAGFGPLEILFIENVGNLVCPASYFLGEDFKVALLSVTEGHDKPFKYPAIFARAAITVVTKVDLLPHVDFDVERVRAQVASLNPSAQVLLVSVKTGAGLDDWCDLLQHELAGRRDASALLETP